MLHLLKSSFLLFPLYFPERSNKKQTEIMSVLSGREAPPGNMIPVSDPCHTLVWRCGSCRKCGERRMLSSGPLATSAHVRGRGAFTKATYSSYSGEGVLEGSGACHTLQTSRDLTSPSPSASRALPLHSSWGLLSQRVYRKTVASWKESHPRKQPGIIN